MALIDHLPEFSAKPLDISEPIRKLAPRPKPEPQDPEKPLMGPPELETLPGESMFIPEQYAEYAPVIQALNDSSIVNPDARAAVIAQLGLEHGWKAPADNNYGNIIVGSTWKGKSNRRGDKNAKGEPITQEFRTYDSPEQFVDDYIALLKRTYPKAYQEILSDNFDIGRFTDGLLDGKYRYAEDPEYKSKVANTYNSVIAKFLENKQ